MGAISCYCLFFFSLLGFGSSAIVHVAVHKPNKKTVAIKMIDLDRFERNQIDELRVN